MENNPVTIKLQASRQRLEENIESWKKRDPEIQENAEVKP